MIKEATLVQPKQWGSSSFHGTTIILTPKQLIDYCEENDISYCNNNDGTGKSNFDFDFETKEGVYFTVYDWKEYRKLNLDEHVEFHIGGNNRSDTVAAYFELKKALK
jgi:hypothetical protein